MTGYYNCTITSPKEQVEKSPSLSQEGLLSPQKNIIFQSTTSATENANELCLPSLSTLNLNFLDICPVQMRNYSTGQSKYSQQNLMEEYSIVRSDKESNYSKLLEIVECAESVSYDLSDRASDFAGLFSGVDASEMRSIPNQDEIEEEEEKIPVVELKKSISVPEKVQSRMIRTTKSASPKQLPRIKKTIEKKRFSHKQISYSLRQNEGSATKEFSHYVKREKKLAGLRQELEKKSTLKELIKDMKQSSRQFNNITDLNTFINSNQFLFNQTVKQTYEEFLQSRQSTESSLSQLTK